LIIHDRTNMKKSNFALADCEPISSDKNEGGGVGIPDDGCARVIKAK
jgi:hypothetical protein